jgi:arylsulfatase A-like enzyme
VSCGYGFGRRQTIGTSFRNYSLVGFGATLLLGVIECADLQRQLTPVFASSSERFIFTSYFTINLLVGTLLGLAIGIASRATAFVYRQVLALTSGRKRPGAFNYIVTWLVMAVIATFLLNLQPQIHAYAFDLIREAEKIPHAARPLLFSEPTWAFFCLLSLVCACSILWMLVRGSAGWDSLPRAVWILFLAALLSVAYYVDSRVEVQQYEYSLHRSMFLLATTTALAIVGSLGLSSLRTRALWFGLKTGTRFTIAIVGLLAVLSGAAYTFARFDRNQNLKIQVFYRTTQTKQYFKLMQWVLDRDRDGYSRFLGGGDADDTNAGINPSSMEVIGDGIDNNCIGGDLGGSAIEEWHDQFRRLHSAPNAAPKRLNLIYFFIDTLRADHLGAYGYQRNTSPNIDKLTARAQFFEHSYTPAPYTYEAVPKFMQSAYWDGHLESWTATLARNGYHTYLFPRRLPMLLRHVKGVETIVHEAGRGLKQTIDSAIETLSAAPADRPFCAYVYIPDPHRPYKPHAEFDFGSSLTDRYDGEIAFTDYHMGRLLNWMEQSGHIKDTMVVVMSDHGESLGERMVYKHNSQLYDEQMRVPMIFYVPGIAPRRIMDYVSTVDLGTTILNLAGIEGPHDAAGVSLLPLMRGENFVHPPVYGEHVVINETIYVSADKSHDPDSRKYMVITQDGFKLIYNRNFYAFELYDLKNDPMEQHNLYDRLPERAAPMKQMVGRFLDIVIASRPWDADEQKFSVGGGDNEDDDQ